MRLFSRSSTFLYAGLLAVAASAQTPIPGKWYEYYTVARTGSTYTSLGNGPSINDAREVGFEGSTSAGNALWFGTGNAAAVNFNPGESFSSNDIISPSVQINSNHQVVSEDRIPTTSPASTNIRLYTATTNDSLLYAARGGLKQVKAHIIVFANPATNINGDVVRHRR